jgi:hypothetical protein
MSLILIEVSTGTVKNGGVKWPSRTFTNRNATLGPQHGCFKVLPGIVTAPQAWSPAAINSGVSSNTVGRAAKQPRSFLFVSHLTRCPPDRSCAVFMAPDLPLHWGHRRRTSPIDSVRAPEFASGRDFSLAERIVRIEYHDTAKAILK